LITFLQPAGLSLRAYQPGECIFQGFAARPRSLSAALINASLVDDRHPVAQPLHHFQHMRRRKISRAFAWSVRMSFIARYRVHAPNGSSIGDSSG
jgi:hypothetical protein